MADAGDESPGRKFGREVLLIFVGLAAGSIWGVVKTLVTVVPWWVTLLAAAVIVLALSGIFVRRFREWLFNLPTELWSFHPVTRRRLDSERENHAAELAATKERYAVDLAKSTRETADAEDRRREELDRQRIQHEKDILVARDVGIACGREQGRNEERWDPDWKQFTPEINEVRRQQRLDEHDRQVATTATESGEAARKQLEDDLRWSHENTKSALAQRDAALARVVELTNQVEASSKPQKMRDALRRPQPDPGQGMSGGPYLPVDPPEPRWRIRASTEPMKYVVENLVPDSVARSVRVECDDSETEIVDAGYWSDLSGKSTGTFTVDHTDHGWQVGPSFWLSWKDHAGLTHAASKFDIPPEKMPDAF